MIFYFTATGNSKYIAEKIAAETGDRLVDIADCIKTGNLSFELEDGEDIGFVVPVYYYAVPMIVSEFLSRFKITSNQDFYSFAVINCGGSTGNAGKFFDSAKVKAIYAVKIVDNYAPLFKVVSESEISGKLANADLQIAEVTEHIHNKDTGIFNSVKGPFPRLLTSIAYPMYTRGRKTSKFTVNKDCTNCGLCAEICPRWVIRIKEEKPVWILPQCELCLACLHRCPGAAINYGKKTEKNGRYVNPNVEL
jgi:flavodoxin/NAD-dependent dihydropyrimidine dehydrogenase PreA subunit